MWIFIGAIVLQPFVINACNVEMQQTTSSKPFERLMPKLVGAGLGGVAALVVSWRIARHYEEKAAKEIDPELKAQYLKTAREIKRGISPAVLVGLSGGYFGGKLWGRLRNVKQQPVIDQTTVASPEVLPMTLSENKVAGDKPTPLSNEVQTKLANAGWFLSGGATANSDSSALANNDEDIVTQVKTNVGAGPGSILDGILSGGSYGKKEEKTLVEKEVPAPAVSEAKQVKTNVGAGPGSILDGILSGDQKPNDRGWSDDDEALLQAILRGDSYGKKKQEKEMLVEQAPADSETTQVKTDVGTGSGSILDGIVSGDQKPNDRGWSDDDEALLQAILRGDSYGKKKQEEEMLVEEELQEVPVEKEMLVEQAPADSETTQVKTDAAFDHEAFMRSLSPTLLRAMKIDDFRLQFAEEQAREDAEIRERVTKASAEAKRARELAAEEQSLREWEAEEQRRKKEEQDAYDKQLALREREEREAAKRAHELAREQEAEREVDETIAQLFDQMEADRNRAYLESEKQKIVQEAERKKQELRREAAQERERVQQLLKSSQEVRSGIFNKRESFTPQLRFISARLHGLSDASALEIVENIIDDNETDDNETDDNEKKSVFMYLTADQKQRLQQLGEPGEEGQDLEGVLSVIDLLFFLKELGVSLDTVNGEIVENLEALSRNELHERALTLRQQLQLFH